MAKLNRCMRHKIANAVGFLVAMFVLTACAAKFDGTEYLEVAAIKSHADVAAMQCATDPTGAVKTHGNEILYHSTLVMNYSENVQFDDNVYGMSQTLRGMVSPLMTRKEVSPVYCREKFKNISDAANIMLKAMGKRER